MRGLAGRGEREAGGVRRKGLRDGHTPQRRSQRQTPDENQQLIFSESEARAGRDLEGGFTKLVFFK